LFGRARWPSTEGVQPCRIETSSGSAIDGELVAFDLDAATLKFRTSAEGAAVRLGFARIRSLTLTVPVLLAEAAPQAVPVWRPDEPGDCAFSVEWAAPGQGVYSGVSAGVSVTRDGLFLFPSLDGFASVDRTFIPHAAYRGLEVAPIDSAGATASGIADREALLQALAAQESAPVPRIGESLIDLGLMNQAQLDETLAAKAADVPIGEALVASGVISRSDLLTGLAHKMGYPFVDLKRFPIELAAAQLMPLPLVKSLRSLPIAIDAGRVIVVVDRPSSLAMLRDVAELAAHKVVIVIAPAARIDDAIARLPRPGDPWDANVPLR
jgi:Type II secretion system (T2SS), protein E, N-terminal domain